jgi:DeoR/GlpR family transcriptional regulator of sugar metabolism
MSNGVTRRTIARDINSLKDKGLVSRDGGDYGGM